MDISTIAQDVVLFLAPALPYLMSIGGQVSEDVRKTIEEEASARIGANVWKQAEFLWSRLHPTLSAKPEARIILSEIMEDPAQEDNWAMLRFQIRKLLREDEILTRDVAAALKASPLIPSTNFTNQGANSSYIAGSVHVKGNFINGNQYNGDTENEKT